MKRYRFFAATALTLLLPQLVWASVIEFEDVPPSTDVPVYSEDGFELTTNVGQVRISDFLSPGDNAAQPSFGFGQGVDSKFILTESDDNPFHLISIELLEASLFPEPWGVTLVGTKSDNSVVTVTFTLDGVAGPETFFLPSAFVGLISVDIEEDASNEYPLDIVLIDDVVLEVQPVPVELSSWGSLKARYQE